jgi:hypothetical protein
MLVAALKKRLLEKPYMRTHLLEKVCKGDMLLKRKREVRLMLGEERKRESICTL